MIRRIISFLVWIWNCLSRRRKKAPGQEPPPLTSDAVKQERLPHPTDIRYPIQDLFAFPLQESQVLLDANVWDGLRLSLPHSYTIPDPEFTRVLAVNASVRTLRWAVGDFDPEPAKIILADKSWNPPYVPPMLERAGNAKQNEKELD